MQKIALLLVLLVATTASQGAAARTIQKQQTRGVHYRHSRGYWTRYPFLITEYCQTGWTRWGYWTRWGTVSSTFRPGTHFSIPGYSRWATEEDTGSAVGYGHLDVYNPSCSGAMQWGRRYERIFIYN